MSRGNAGRYEKKWYYFNKLSVKKNLISPLQDVKRIKPLLFLIYT